MKVKINRVSFTCPVKNKMVSVPAGALTLVTYIMHAGGYLTIKCSCGEEHEVSFGDRN